jgi:hypothetical protein
LDAAMDINKAQEIIDEIEAICHKHKVILLGGSVCQNIIGEIRILKGDDLSQREIEHLSSGDRPYIHNGEIVVNGIA